MEVHKHPQNVTHKKNLGEYLLEFIMIFLAVTLGFFAENIREGVVEGGRARDYARSLIEDLKKDTTALRQGINFYKMRNNRIKKFRELMRNKGVNEIPGGLVYYYGNPSLNFYRITFNDATIEQLKSSGALRYFRKISIQKEISEYDRYTREVLTAESYEPFYLEQRMQFAEKLFDADVLDIEDPNDDNKKFVDSFLTAQVKLKSYDQNLWAEYAGFCRFRQERAEYRLREYIEPALNEANKLITLLQHEYHLHDEK